MSKEEEINYPEDELSDELILDEDDIVPEDDVDEVEFDEEE